MPGNHGLASIKDAPTLRALARPSNQLEQRLELDLEPSSNNRRRSMQ
jgi:hypothetical protein